MHLVIRSIPCPLSLQMQGKSDESRDEGMAHLPPPSRRSALARMGRQTRSLSVILLIHRGRGEGHVDIVYISTERPEFVFNLQPPASIDTLPLKNSRGCRLSFALFFSRIGNKSSIEFKIGFFKVFFPSPSVHFFFYVFLKDSHSSFFIPHIFYFSFYPNITLTT
jgi:hypothetical protein